MADFTADHADHNDQGLGYEDSNKSLRTFCGIVLILFGGVVVALLLHTIHGVLNSPTEMPIVQRLTPKDPEARCLGNLAGLDCGFGPVVHARA